MGDAAEVAAPPPAEDVPAPAPASVLKNTPRYFTHWKRPTFLQYKYISDFRQNYYSDLIDYLDSRSRGVRQDAPKPQYWAERALRYSRDRSRAETERVLASANLELLSSIRQSTSSYTIRRSNVSRRVTSFII